MKSRFDKLETERSEAEPAEAEGRLDARFNRFDADGADGLGLDRDPLAKLPMLQCPACQTDCGKFETACSRCGASLTDDAARAHNLKRAEALQAERAAEQVVEEAKRKEEIAQLAFDRIRAREVQEGMADELHDKYADPDTARGPAWPFVVAAVVCFGLARLVPWFGLKVVFVAAGSLCLLTRLPRSAWRALARPARRFRGW